MKSTILLLTIAFSLLATVFTRSQESNPFEGDGDQKHTPRMIRIQAEFIEMPQPTYTSLMAKPRTSANDTNLRAECAKLIEKGEAGILETMCLTALPGQSATVESIAELTYPTEYNPGRVPERVNGATPPPDTPWGSPPTPSSFDTKNTGSTLEVEAHIDSNGKVVELRLSPTIVYHVDTINWGSEKRAGAAGPIEMPVFHVLKMRTGVILVDGQPCMIAAQSPKDDKGFTDGSRKIMVFVRAEILNVGQ